MSDAPWLKTFVLDWLGDPALRACSLAARAVFADCRAVMHRAEPYGHLLINGRAPSEQQLARIIGVSVDEVEALIGELEEAGLLSRTEAGVLVCERLIEEGRASAEGRKAADKRWAKVRPEGRGASEAAEAIEVDGSPIGGGMPNPHAKKSEVRSQKAAAAVEGAELPAAALPDEAKPAAAAAIDDLDERREKASRERRTAEAVDLLRWICGEARAPNGYRNDLGSVVAWLDQGMEAADVKAGVAAVLARDRGQLPTSLRYFEGAIGDARRKRLGLKSGSAREPKAEPRVITWRTATAENWHHKLRLWARYRTMKGPDQETWPEFARWRDNDLMGPPPGRDGCKAPQELIDAAIGETGGRSAKTAAGVGR